MPASFPHLYTATVTRDGPSRAVVEAPPRPALRGAPPPEFDGPDDTWSPEHLLLGSLGLCFQTTLEALARRAGVPIRGLRAVVTGNLDKTKTGLAFTGFWIGVELGVAAADAPRARELVDRAHRSCIVANSLRVPIGIALTLDAAPAVA
jgi:organic hydroperoxide reductase OsmC/OhrA